MSELTVENLNARADALAESQQARESRLNALYAEVRDLYTTLSVINPECTKYAAELESLGTDVTVEATAAERQRRRVRDLKGIVDEIIEEVEEKPTGPKPFHERSMAGYCKRLGGFMKPEWQRRYFSVDGGVFSRFSNDTAAASGKSKGTIELENIVAVGPIQAPVDHIGNPFCFSMRVRLKGDNADETAVEYFSCPDDEARGRWMEALAPMTGVTSVTDVDFQSEVAQWSRRRFKSPFA